jgi:ribA/ribD-fused uncharacterized protein
MYYKARVFGDQRAATEIMRCLNPGDMKRIGARVRGFNQEQWYPVSIYVMLVASTAKYRQNARLRQELFSTAPSLMVEAAPFDRRWGCGVGMDSDAIKERRRWPGKNLLGRMLTLVRDQLIAEEKGDCVIRRPIEVKKEEVGKDDEKKAKVRPSKGPFGVVEPELGLVEHESGLVEPEFSLVKPDLGLVEPEFGLVEPELGLVELELGIVEPRSGLVEP